MNAATVSIEVSGAEVDDLRRLVSRGLPEGISRIAPRGLTLEGALELACSWWRWQQGGNAAATTVLEEWARTHSLLERARAALAGGGDVVEDYAAPVVEIRAVPRHCEVDEPPWSLFRQRYRRSLVHHGGFEKKFADGLVGAFEEMVDNVVQHSGPTAATAAPGVVGYEVRPGHMQFVVVDVGQGVLASLRRNPAWQHLEASAEALRATICEDATSRAWLTKGTGFRQVFRAIADYHGVLRFRTGDAVLLLDGRGEARRAIQRASPDLDGLQLSVSCAFSDT